MASLQFETQHEDMIHDSQMDYYGKRVATCSSDRTIKIFDSQNGQYVQVAHLKRHEGPVWQVCWAHPKFGNLLASCSYDGQVIVWKEESPGMWNPVYENRNHQESVNAVDWAPHDLGLILACASSDGNVSVHTYRDDGTWDAVSMPAHATGCCSVSWAPSVTQGALFQHSDNNPRLVKRFVTGGCDNNVTVWTFNEMEGRWAGSPLQGTGASHSDWVRGVAWAPSIGLPFNTIASCSEDRQVIIWNEDEQGTWRSTKLPVDFGSVVWQVSWSVTGNILAVSCGDGKVTLWKESLDGEWKQLSEVEDTTSSAAQQPAQ